MTLTERLRRVPPVGWAALVAAVLVVPGLGSFGFWDPWELNVADRARAMMRSGSLFDSTVVGRFTREPPLDLFLAALGMKLFGVRELGARFFNAVFAIVALLGVYWAGAGMFSRRAAALGTVVLATMPIFILQARQLTSDMPLVAGLALALGGFGRYAWPASAQRRWGDLLVAAVGLAVGLLSGGALLGVALPCLAIAGAMIVNWGSLRSRGGGGLVPLYAVAALGLVVLVVTLTTGNIAARFSLLLGGTPRGGTPSQMFEYIVKQIGFGIFPWSALAVFALGRALVRVGEDEHGNALAEHGWARRTFAQTHLLIFAAFGFALTTVFVLMTGDARFAALAPLALAVGVFLDEALEGETSEPVLGLLVATGTLVVARDFFLEPDELVSVHLLSKVKWPPAISLGPWVLVAGLVVGAGIYAALAARGRALGKIVATDLGQGGKWKRRLETLVVAAGRWGVHVAVAAALLFAGVLVHALVPALSKHFSFRPVFESYARFAKPGEQIGRYRVEGHGTAFYSARDIIEIPSQDRLVQFLGGSARVFSLVGAEDLAAIDAALKVAGTPYFVVDSSSSRFLLLSNKMGEGEEDGNPLKKNVWMAPRPPEKTVNQNGEEHYEWHGQVPPWGEPRVPVSAVFAGNIELLGADYPATIRRPGKIPLKLFFRVNARPSGSFKVFCHFDAAGQPRLLGDHAPLEGAFPTSNWLPGEYVLDQVEVDVPLMTTPAGTYTLLVGFWPGGEGKRWKITSGANDGADRARVGTIEIR